MKYKIQISEGCTSYYTKINDNYYEDMSETEKLEFIQYLSHKLIHGLINNEISINSVIGVFQYDEYNYDSKSCDQCGDTVSVTTWNI